jgi:DnaJ-class molecular chaperone
MKKKKAAGQLVEVECAFCKGVGTDPFDLMSPLSTCQVCSGTGRRQIEPPLHKCAFCGGSGVHPHSRMVCMSCNGIGQVTVPANAVCCPGCHGTGKESSHHFHDSVLSCLICGGKGVVDPESVVPSAEPV